MARDSASLLDALPARIAECPGAEVDVLVVDNDPDRSGAAPSEVAPLPLRYVAEPRAVEVEVLDDGHPAPGRDTGGGYGLRGIAERAALHDGVAEVGPRPQGGWRVRVRVPVAEP